MKMVVEEEEDCFDPRRAKSGPESMFVKVRNGRAEEKVNQCFREVVNEQREVNLPGFGKPVATVMAPCVIQTIASDDSLKFGK